MRFTERKYRIRGLVQGVGFRPRVAALASEFDLAGNVSNSGGSVVLRLKGEEQVVDEWIRRLFLFEGVDSVELLSEKKLTQKPEPGFYIIPSELSQDGVRFLPSDIATCPTCEQELWDPSNRRFRHPFISCVSCGPRFSIMKRVPYDRENTTMADFPLCDPCADEYVREGDRRRHAQTICCSDCGPEVMAFLRENITREKNNVASGRIVKGEGAIQAAIAAIQQGKIVAIKDIGGYHFAFLATENGAAKRLRVFKHRESKPFAVMFFDIESVEKTAEISQTETELLSSPERPIVLLKRKDDAPIASSVCADSERIGAMLPCNPLQMLIVRETGPLVMTSGNRGKEPIIIDDDAMLSLSKEYGLPDLVLYHDRTILTGLDDSICQVVCAGGREFVQILRRARGFVPKPIFFKHFKSHSNSLTQRLGEEIDDSRTNISASFPRLSADSFAAGGDLKSVFALGKEDAVFLSGHFGDLEDLRAVQARSNAIAHMKALLDVQPLQFARDLHPTYVSSRELDEAERQEMEGVQHHHAHILSVVAEHGLSEEVIGVAFDGTGYGTDGSIWGGEFLLCKGRRYTRVGYLYPVEMLAGDISAVDCDSAAFAYLYSMDEKSAWEFAKAVEENFQSSQSGKMRSRFSKAENEQSKFALWGAALKHKTGVIPCSSMGRLFDAAAAVLDIAHKNAYEGQAPLLLQQAAERYVRRDKKLKGDLKKSFASLPDFAEQRSENAPFGWWQGLPFAIYPKGAEESLCSEELFQGANDSSMKNNDKPLWIADLRGLLSELLTYRIKGYDVDFLAWVFHWAVAEMTVELCRRIRGRKKTSSIPVVLSGGSMQNALLLKMLVEGLENENFNVYLNEKVPCGDGGLALGQMYYLALEGWSYL